MKLARNCSGSTNRSRQVALSHARCRVRRPLITRALTIVTRSQLQQLRPAHVTAPNDDTGGLLEARVLARPNTHITTVSLKKPLGLTLAERDGRIVVESVNPGGHAEAAGVAAGDVLLATTARAQVGSGNNALRSQLVLLSTAGEKFSTVTAAIRSNTCSQCYVHLILERPE